MKMVPESPSSDTNKEDLSERLAGTRQTIKVEANQNQNQTTTTTSASASGKKTMSSNEAPLVADEATGGSDSVRAVSIQSTARDVSSATSNQTTTSISGSISSSTTMRPTQIDTNSTMPEDDYYNDDTNDDSKEADLETSSTTESTIRNKVSALSVGDSNEAQENQLSSVVVDPDDSITVTTNNNNNNNNGTVEEVGHDSSNNGESDDDEERQRQIISRRLFLNKHKPNFVADEIKKLKNQGSKLLAKNPLKRKRSKKKTTNNLIKPMRPRLGTTTADYGNLISAYNSNSNSNNNNQHHHQVSATNAISNTIRQHFPSMLANPTQQLSTTVQKLIMSKLIPSASNQQSVSINLQGKRPNQLHTSAQQLMGGGGGQQPSSYLDNARLVEALSQLASSSNNLEDSPYGASPSSAHLKPHMQSALPLPGQQGNKMIPIEIIGLDPSVTNNILQSYESEQSGSSPSLVNPQLLQMYPTTGGQQQEPSIYHHHQDRSNNQQQSLAQQLQQLQSLKAVDGLSKFPRASSILHIHHFHTQTAPPGKAGGAGSPSTQALVGINGAPEMDPHDSDAMRSPSPQQQLVQAQRLITTGGGPQAGPQKVYINDKGQVVYLSVEDQSEGKGMTAAGNEQQQDVSSVVGESQQLVSEGPETRPAGEVTEQQQQQQQQQDIQQAQQDYAQQAGVQIETDQQQQQQSADAAASGNQQAEQQQVETINLANEQPTSLQTNGPPFRTSILSPNYARNLSYSKSQAGEPKQQRVYLTNNGQTISLIGGGRGSPEASEAGEGQQLLMVSYKPQQQQQQQQQQQFRNLTEDLFSQSQRQNPYNEGQESKPSFIAANHLLAGAPQLLKSSSLMLRPMFPVSQQSAGRFANSQQQQLYVNNSVMPLDEFSYDLMRLRQQQPLSLSDMLARLNGTLPIGADLSHLDAMRTGNKSSLLLHGMLNSLSTPPQPSSEPSLAQLSIESIPLTIVPLHQAANMSYQFGLPSQQQQLQLLQPSGRLSPQPENRVPSLQTNPALKALVADLTDKNLHQALLAANQSSRLPPGSSGVELANQHSSWTLPEAASAATDKQLSAAAANLLQSNGYNTNKALTAIMALRNNYQNGTMFGGSSQTTLGLPSSSSQNFLLENLTFLKHLREMKERLKLTANAEPQSPPPLSPTTLISHHHLVPLNNNNNNSSITNKLTNDNLLSLLNELRSQTNGNTTTTTINLSPQSPLTTPLPILSLPIVESFPLTTSSSSSANLEPPISGRPYKLGQSQAPLQVAGLPASPTSGLSGPIQTTLSNNNNKHVRSKIISSISNNANLSGIALHNGLINNEHHQRNLHQKASIGNNKDQRTAMESQQSDVSLMPPTLSSTTTSNHLDKHRQPMVSMVSDDSEFVGDNSGLGTIALVFIFISLISLTFLAASMIYRHKRRSVGRCADLPSRSRLNLTQRTKHFVRSNFVNPGDVTSIKSVNGLNSGGSSSSSKSTRNSNNNNTNNLRGGRLTSATNNSKVANLRERAHQSKNTPDINEMRLGSPATNSTRTGASENRYNLANSNNININTKKPFGPSLSTFNTHNPQLMGGANNSDKYHFSSNSSKQSSETIVTDSNTDIKTLNTRLQKPPYLKSLISTPDCLLWNTKRQQHHHHHQTTQSNASNKSDCFDTDAGNAFYLNIRNQVAASSTSSVINNNINNNNKQNGLSKTVSSSPMLMSSDNSCKLSPSFKKPDGSEAGSSSAAAAAHRHQYGTPVKDIASQLGASNCRLVQQTCSSTTSDSNSKHNAYSNRSRPSTTMTTIHSISRDSIDSKSNSSSPPSQIKQQQQQRQVNIVGRMLGGKLNNLPAPKHLVAGAMLNNNNNASDERNHSSSSNSNNQIDRL